MATVPVSSDSSLAMEQAVVRSSLDRVARRIRFALWVRYVSYAAIFGSVLSVAAVFAQRLGRLEWPLIPLIAAFYVVAVAIATFAAFRSRIPLLAVARLADDRQGLKQRLSSSLALSDDPISLSSPFLRLQMADAAAIAPGLDARKVLPMRFRWEAVAAIVSVLLAAFVTALALRAMGVGFANGSGPVIVAQEGAKLALDAKRIAREADAQKLPETRQYAQKLAQLAQQMQSRKMPQQEAVKRLSSLSAQVRQQQQQLAKQSAANTSSQANPSASTPLSNSPANQKQAASDESLGDTLRKMADQLSSNPLPPSAQKQMAQALSKLSSQARGAGFPQTAQRIQQASKALAERNQAQAASELRQAAKMADLEEKQAQQKADQLAKSQNGPQTQSKIGNGAHNPQQGNPAGQQAKGDKGQTDQGKPSAQGEQAGQKAKEGQQSQAGQQSQTASQAHPGQATPNGQAGQNPDQSGNQAQPGQGSNSSDAQGMQSIERSLQQAQERLSGQSGPSSPNGSSDQASSQKSGSGNGQSSKPGSGKGRMGQGGYNAMPQQAGNSGAKGGAPSNVTNGEGKGSPTSPGKYAPSQISGKGYQTPKSNQGVWRGQPQQIDNYSPSRNNRYARIYLPSSGQSGSGTTKNDSSPPGAGPAGGQSSSVPYYQVYPQFKKSAEAALDKEDIPRAYAKKVRQYFQSLTPTSAR